MRRVLILTIVAVLSSACAYLAQAADSGSTSVSAAGTTPTNTERLLRVTLNDTGSVRGHNILLRDVATVDGSTCSDDLKKKALDTYVGTASVPGENRTLTRAQILVRLRGAGFRDEEVQFLGAEKIQVWRESQIVTGTEISDIAVQALRDKMPWPAEDVTIEVVREPEDLTVGQGAVEIKVDESFGYRGFGQGLRSFSAVSVPVDVLLDGKSAKRITVPIRVRAFAMAAVAAVNIARNDIITEDILQMTRVDISTATGEIALDPEQVIGKRALRALRAGQPIGLGMVVEPPAVHRGDLVAVISQFGGVIARVQGKATKDGRIGDTVPVRVSYSKKELQAVVVDSGTVEVRP